MVSRYVVPIGVVESQEERMASESQASRPLQHTWPGGTIVTEIGYLRSLCRRAGVQEYWAYQRWFDIPLAVREQINAFARAKGWEYVE